jgi:hypothetical protein
METHACAIENNGLLVNDLVVRSKALFALGHDGVMDEFRAADMVVDQLGCCNILGQTFDIVLALLKITEMEE